MASELAVSLRAERQGDTIWRRRHIGRHGLMNIIVLGECFLAIVAIIRPEGSG